VTSDQNYLISLGLYFIGGAFVGLFLLLALVQWGRRGR
jgi:hypothetical protein